MTARLTSLKSLFSLGSFILLTALMCLGGCKSDSNQASSQALDEHPNLSRLTQRALALEPAFPKLTFSKPVAIKEAPGDGNQVVSSLIYVAEQDGRLSSFVKSTNSQNVKTVIDISAKVLSRGEQGLLSFAFDPKFVENGYIYLHYSERPKGDTVVSRFFIDPRSGIAEIQSELRILTHPQPYINHNGGEILFGPDGYLYIALGDGGSGGDPHGNAQNLSSLLGKILRIDVSHSTEESPYSIPPSNPFVADKANARPEIFAYGLRNPWKISFDPKTEKLWAGDVGQNSKEEIDIISIGGNYGWNVMEGFDCYPPNTTNCSKEKFVSPVYEYPRSDGQSITAGLIYRGNKIKSLRGRFVFGDFMSGRIWALDAELEIPNYNNSPIEAEVILDSKLNISSFGSSSEGDLYLVSYYNGQIYRFID